MEEEKELELEKENKLLEQMGRQFWVDEGEGKVRKWGLQDLREFYEKYPEKQKPVVHRLPEWKAFGDGVWVERVVQEFGLGAFVQVDNRNDVTEEFSKNMEIKECAIGDQETVCKCTSKGRNDEQILYIENEKFHEFLRRFAFSKNVKFVKAIKDSKTKITPLQI